MEPINTHFFIYTAIEIFNNSEKVEKKGAKTLFSVVVRLLTLKSLQKQKGKQFFSPHLRWEVFC